MQRCICRKPVKFADVLDLQGTQRLRVAACILSSNRSEIVWHYPLPNGKWLVTRLQGSDIDKVIEYAVGGAPKFKVDE